MIGTHPRTIILIGFLLVVSGVVLPLLMVLKVIPSSFILNFLAYGASVLGVMLGLMGAALWTRIDTAKRRGRNRDDDWR